MRAAVFLLLVFAGAAFAEDQDEDALSLADKAPQVEQRAGDWRIFAEVATGGSELRSQTVPDSNQRLSLDARLDKSLSPNWRAVFADRVDYRWFSPPRDEDAVNTLKEAYVSWLPQSERIVDVGRINVRHGVATGYNPTDYFKVNAVRSVVSITPASLKENRQGSIMGRGQTLWMDGSLTALYSPKLADRRDSDAYSLDVGSTNQRDRWLVVVSQKISDGFNPQWLLFGQQDESPQYGLNLTSLLNDATVAYFEWSGGRSESLLSQAMGGDEAAFRNRVAVGFTYTAATKLSFTLEYDYNGAALDRAAWEQLSRNPLAYLQYRRYVQSVQEPPTKQNAFLYATWQDAILLHLDISLMQRRNIADSSRQSWMEARYHWDRADFAIQRQINSGGAGSEFGALPEQQVWQALVAYFF